MLSARSPRARRIVGLAAAPALLLALVACGDDDDGSGDSAGGDFSEQARSLSDRYDEMEEPTREQFGDALDAIRSMDPPAEIAGDWDTMMDALEGFEDIDLENPDPEPMAALEDPEAQEASDRVDAYMSDECGIE